MAPSLRSETYTRDLETVRLIQAFPSRAALARQIIFLRDALEIVLVQFGEYKDGEGAAKYHAINIAKAALASLSAAKDA